MGRHPLLHRPGQPEVQRAAVRPAAEFPGQPREHRSAHLRSPRPEPRTVSNEAAKELREYLGKLTTKIDAGVFGDLNDIARRHADATVFVEKAVDVFLAIDFVTMAIADAYDAAYLLTADGDYTPAVEAVRKLGKKVSSQSLGRAARCPARRPTAKVVQTRPLLIELNGREAIAGPAAASI